MTKANQFLSFRLERKKYDNQYVQRYILYNGDMLYLTDEQFDDLIVKIPEVWNSDKDRLIYFSMTDDNKFVCYRNKDTYNYATKEVIQKGYYFDAATEKEVSNLVSIVLNYYTNLVITNTQKFYDDIIESLSETSFTKQKILELRDQELKKSDFMFNLDYTFKTEEEKQNWINYRQQWRDITTSDFWINDDFINLQLPVSPNAENLFFSMRQTLTSYYPTNSLGSDYLEEIGKVINKSGYEKLYNNFTKLSLQISILNALTELNIPLGFDEEKMSKIRDILYKNSISNSEDDENTDSLTIVENYLAEVERKISLVDSTLSEINANFKVTDIINSMLEDIKKKSQQFESEKQAVDLIIDTMMQGEET